MPGFSSYAGRRTMPGGSGTTRYSPAAVIPVRDRRFPPIRHSLAVTAHRGRRQAIIVEAEAGWLATFVWLELRQGCLLECKVGVQIDLRRVD